MWYLTRMLGEIYWWDLEDLDSDESQNGQERGNLLSQN
jgi:hypothetical protein